MAHTPPSALIVTDGKAGDLVQCRGVAESMGLSAAECVVRPRAPFGWLAPHGPLDPRDKAALAKHAPDIVIASGRRAVPALAFTKARTSDEAFTVCLKNPRKRQAADFVWVPAHDGLPGGDAMATVLSPHTLTAERIAVMRSENDADLANSTTPIVTMLLGGPSRGAEHSSADVERLAARLDAMSETATLLVTPSRRTPPEMLASITSALRGSHRVWNGRGTNPYLSWMAAADALVVTGDSVNMVGEALAMGRPVYVARPSRVSRRIGAFLEAVRREGWTRDLDAPLTFEPQAPQDATPAIAAEALKRYEAHRAALRK